MKITPVLVDAPEFKNLDPKDHSPIYPLNWRITLDNQQEAKEFMDLFQCLKTQMENKNE